MKGLLAFEAELPVRIQLEGILGNNVEKRLKEVSQNG